MNNKLITLLYLFFFISCESTDKSPIFNNSFLENEIIYVVTMKSNGKTSDEISIFSRLYTELIEYNEPYTYGWGFFQKGENIMLIERYKNESAALNHINNISPGGNLEKQFGQFINHFEIVEINVYGNISDNLKTTINEFNIPTSYNSTIAKYSRE
tara:strand:+ start:534 stop:1001 length:468 start_codon:yes stop_codon:yes gene_type:complete